MEFEVETPEVTLQLGSIRSQAKLTAYAFETRLGPTKHFHVHSELYFPSADVMDGVENVLDDADWKYKSGGEAPLGRLLRHFADANPEWSIYLTDELANNKPSEAFLVEKPTKQIWMFDAAILPKSAQQLMGRPPENWEFAETKIGRKSGLAFKSRWRRLPWDA